MPPAVQQPSGPIGLEGFFLHGWWCAVSRHDASMEPPCSNHGGQVSPPLPAISPKLHDLQRVALPAPVDNSQFLPPTWDWYSCTLQADPSELLAHLSASVDLSDIRPARGMYGYQRGAEVARGSRVFSRVWWGGNGQGIHVTATGGTAPGLVRVVRDEFPDHRVTRCDSAVDLRGAPWALVERMALGVADKYRISVTHVGDFHRAHAGRTLYLGATSSVVRVVIYEKGIKEGGDHDWIRVECRVRPKRDREQVATLSPSEVWGAADFSRDILAAFTSLDVRRFQVGTVYRPTDAERALEFMLRQYGERMRERADEIGADTLLATLAQTIKGSSS